ALMRHERSAEVSLQEVREPRDVLERERLIEAEILTDRGDGRRIALLSGEDERRVRRRQAYEDEHADGDEERHRDHEQEATEDVSRHSVASAFTSLCGLLLQPSGLETRDAVRIRLHPDKALHRDDRRDVEAVQ